MNLEAEKAVIAALINLNDFASTLPFKLTEDDFFERGNKAIIKVINKLMADGVIKFSKELINSTARDMNLTEFNTLTKDGQIIDELCKRIITKDEAIVFLKQVKKESLRFAAVINLESLTDYLDTTDEPLIKMLAKCEDTIFKLTSSADFSENTIIRLSDEVDEYIKFLGNNPGQDGLDIGFAEWQRRLGGIGNGKVHMVIATNKTGKSTIGLHAARLLSKFIPVLVVDTEMTKEDQILRTLGMITKVPYEKIKEGHWMNPKEEDYKFYDRLMQGIKDFKGLNIHYLSASGKSVVDMIPAMRRWVIQHKAASDGKFPRGLIVYDYLKLTSYEELAKAKLQEWQKLGLDAGALKDFAIKYKIPVLTFGQTNREDDDTINCLGASKRLADLCDSITLFKAKTPEILAKDPIGTHLMRVFVSRHGPSTDYNQHIRVNFDKSIGYLEELGLYTSASGVQTTRKYKKKNTVAALDAVIDELSDIDADDEY